MRQAGLEGKQKTSVSDVVTAADHAAEAYVLEQLRRCRPDDGILGEEGASVAGSSGRTWVIDPVDGTYNFLHGSTYWCSAIALKDSSGAGLGAIFQPEEDKLWLGGTSRAATLNGERLVTFLPDASGGKGRNRHARRPNSAPQRTSTRPGSPIRCAPCPGMRRRHPRPPCACSDPAPATSAGWPTASSAAGSSTVAPSGTGCPARPSSRPPAAPPTRAGQRTRLVHCGRYDGGAAVACRAQFGSGRLGFPAQGRAGRTCSVLGPGSGDMLIFQCPAPGDMLILCC